MKENNKNKVLKSARIEKEISDKIDEILYGKKYTFTDVINAALFNFFENKNNKNENLVYITISEGKFHQVKRMFKAVNNEVLYLKRVKMGNLLLDENLKLGEYRELTAEELDSLKV